MRTIAYLVAMIYLVTIASILGAAQGLFLTFTLLALRKHRLPANKFLALVLLILSVTLIIAFLHFSRLVLKTPHLFNVTPLLTPLYGPLLYLYIRHLLDANYRFTPWQLLHFLPFCLFVRLHWPMLNKGGETKILYLVNIFEDRWLPPLNTPAGARMAHLATYLVICLALYLAASRREKQQTNGTSSSRLAWIRNLIAASVVIWSVYTFLYFYDQNLLNLTAPFVVTATLYTAGYFALKHPDIFRDVQLKPFAQKYEASRLTEAEKMHYRGKLVDLMNVEKIYRRADLKLVLVADRLQISVQNLSQVVNECFNQNFPDFINSYRVEEAGRLLLAPEYKHLTIVAIANEVGFNSKSAFNSAFKRFTGKTPTEFIKAGHSLS